MVDGAQQDHIVQHELYGPFRSAGEESVFTDWGLGIGEIPQSLLYYSTKMVMLSEPSLRIVW